jgi:hypothetical protein
MFSASKTAAPSASAISKSLRFRANNLAYMSRTYGTPTASSWTMSVWLKRGALSTLQSLFGYYSSAFYGVRFDAANTITVNGTSGSVATTAVFADTAAWYNLIVNYDGTTVNIYINNVLYGTGSATVPLNANGVTNYLSQNGNSSQYFDGYLASFYFVDGQALTPSSFGYTNPATNTWTPKAYAGTYGTNGSSLLFTNATNTTTIAADTSGNGNNWTASGISVTSGVSYDSMTDVPIPINTTTGNFATFQPSSVVNSGNLAISSTGSNGAISNFSLESGAYYFEITTVGTGTAVVTLKAANGYVGSGANAFATRTIPINSTNGFRLFTTPTTLTLEYTTSGGAFTAMNNTFTVPYPNSFYIDVGVQASTTAWLNCGQRPFVFSGTGTPPTAGYSSVNTYNLAVPSAGVSTQYMTPTLYTGTGATQTVSNGSFLPGLVWIKKRNNSYSHVLTDTVRGVTKTLSSNSNSTETTYAQGLQSFLPTGFTVGTDTGFNNASDTYVAWQWAAGSSVTNNDGARTSIVSANTNAGFSIVQYDGGGGGISTTVGHGLGVTPMFYLLKEYFYTTGNWTVYNVVLQGLTPGRGLILDTQSASASSSALTSAPPTTSVITVGSGANVVDRKYIIYCWAMIPGFSSFGSYSGTGYTAPDGPTVVTGFKPAFILIKKDAVFIDWFVFDSTRNTFNNVGERLSPNNTDSGLTNTYIQILSNGFKINTTQTSLLSSGTFYYFAFAQNPFKYAIGQ